MQEVSYSGRVPHLIDEHVYRPVVRASLRGRRARPPAPERAARHVRRYLIALVVVLLAAAKARDRSDERRVAVAGAVQLVGGLALAPLLPGLVQHWKARLQGRRGPTPLQPYRELRRLWGKSTVDVEGTSVVYRARARGRRRERSRAAVLLVPVAAHAPGLGVGHDVLALRRAARARALRRRRRRRGTSRNGFSLMGASRDLTIAVVGRGDARPLARRRGARRGHDDLTGMVAGTAGTGVWSNPALALGAVAFALVVVAETGRQPVDNPDTHLELTMIHEGPLLEYAGRDLALPAVGRGGAALARARARRAGLPAARRTASGGSSRCCRSCSSRSAPRSRSIETLVAKMRILLVPRLLAVGAVAALLGIVSLAGADA